MTLPGSFSLYDAQAFDGITRTDAFICNIRKRSICCHMAHVHAALLMMADHQQPSRHHHLPHVPAECVD
jgi:hypothetical protein